MLLVGRRWYHGWLDRHEQQHRHDVMVALVVVKLALMPPYDRLDHLLQRTSPRVPRLRVPPSRVPRPRPRRRAVAAVAAGDRGRQIVRRAR